MRFLKTCTAAALAAALAAGPLPAQEGGNTAQEIQKLRRDIQRQQREIEALQRQLGGPNAKPGQKGFLSLAGEHINLRGRLEFEYFGAQPESVSNYRSGGSPAVGKVKGTDFHVDSLTVYADVDFIRDVYLRTELQFRGGNEDKSPDAGHDYEVALPQAYFSFDNILVDLAGLDDPLHTFIQLGAMRPWQYEMFPRHTETYGLPETLFYRDFRTGLRIGGQTDGGFFYRFCLDDGNQFQIMNAGDYYKGYIQTLQDNEDNDGPSHHKDVELGVGCTQDFENGFKTRAAVWYRYGKLNHDQKQVLADPRLGLGGLSSSSKKRRLGTILAMDYTSDFGVLGLQAEWHDAKDANLDRRAWAFQPSFKLLFDGTLYQERRFFNSLEFLYRFSSLRVFGGAPSWSTPPDSALAAADLRMHTFAAILEITYNVKLSAEYTIVDEGTDHSIDNNEFLLHLGIDF